LRSPNKKKPVDQFNTSNHFQSDKPALRQLENFISRDLESLGNKDNDKFENITAIGGNGSQNRKLKLNNQYSTISLARSDMNINLYM
jgi:hypothetical protein